MPGKPEKTGKPPTGGKPPKGGKPQKGGKPEQAEQPPEATKPPKAGKPAGRDEAGQPGVAGELAAASELARTGRSAEAGKPPEAGKPAGASVAVDVGTPAEAGVAVAVAAPDGAGTPAEAGAPAGASVAVDVGTPAEAGAAVTVDAPAEDAADAEVAVPGRDAAPFDVWAAAEAKMAAAEVDAHQADVAVAVGAHGGVGVDDGGPVDDDAPAGIGLPVGVSAPAGVGAVAGVGDAGEAADAEGGHRGSRARLVRRPLATTAVLAGLLAIVGGAIGLTRLHGHPADIARPLAKSAPAPHGIFAAPPQARSAKPVARPVELTIPRIRVHTRLETLGRTPQGTLQVPDSTTVAGWYTGSPRPGEIGSSIIAGHIDSTTGPGVFFRLRLLRPGNLVYVRRAGGTLAVFRVYAEHMYPKADFPTQLVYGPVPDAELHLITCGGVFDPVTGSYLSNVVVYARQISVHQPRHHQPGRRHGHHPRARHS